MTQKHNNSKQDAISHYSKKMATPKTRRKCQFKPPKSPTKANKRNNKRMIRAVMEQHGYTTWEIQCNRYCLIMIATILANRLAQAHEKLDKQTDPHRVYRVAADRAYKLITKHHEIAPIIWAGKMLNKHISDDLRQTQALLFARKDGATFVDEEQVKELYLREHPDHKGSLYK